MEITIANLMKTKETIENLLKQKYRVYMYLKDTETAKKFLLDAELEGYTFGDGVKPTCRQTDDIFAINEDMTINFVGYNGHLTFRIAKRIGDENLLKVDYSRYINGKDNYYVQQNE